MGEIKKQEISAVSEDIKQAIARKSAASLPVNPTEKGFKPQDIINMLYKPIIDTANSAISEIDRVVKEANVALTQIISDTNNEFETRDNSNTEFKEKYDKTVEELKVAISKMGINSITHIGTDENGGNIYRIYAHNSKWSGDFVAPKGDTGDGVASVLYEGTDENGGNVYKQTYTSGKTASFTAPKGIKGDKGDKGDKGNDFTISKTYSSVSEMEAAYASDDVPLYGFALIDTGNVNDTDNAKLYFKGDSGYMFLSDLSGAQGIKGEKGDPGSSVESVEFMRSSTDGNMYKITFTDGFEATFIAPRGEKGATGADAEEYPIGFPYISNENISPSEKGFVGTWLKVPEGHTIIGAGVKYPAGSTGGSADAVIVEHTHNFIGIGYDWEGYDSGNLFRHNSGSAEYNNPSLTHGSYDSSSGYIKIKATGESGIGKNMSPYVAYYVWIRIA